MSDTSTDMDLTPPEIQNTAKSVIRNLLPIKSRDKYKKVYENFKTWQINKKTNSFSESVMLTYFDELSKKYKSSTLWGIYSMLKATLNTEHNINIKNYTKLLTLLKRLSEGFQSKKSNVLTAENVESFLRDAPDEMFLATKVILIFGVNGACRTAELINIKIDDIEKHHDMILVKLKNTKTKTDRSFIIRDEFLEIVKKYHNLRPENAGCDRFFLNYVNGKCTKQPIGRHKLGAIPKTIAAYLKLPDAESYTGHCFRRTSATLLADSGANLTTLKRHGGWASDKVAEGYIADSVENKVKVNHQINEAINLRARPSTSADTKAGTSTPKETLLSNSPHSASFDDIPSASHSIPAEMTQNTNINVPGKNISLSYHNCPNANINITFN